MTVREVADCSSPVLVPAAVGSEQGLSWPLIEKKRVERLVAVSEPEFERFFLRHYDQVVRSLTVVLGDEETARDCAQEAFIKAAARWGKVKRYDNPVAWVRRVAINRGRDLYRTDSRRRRREEGLASTGDLDHRDSSGVVDESMRLVELLQQLPPMQRASAALFYIDDLPVAEIARQLDVSSGAVKFHLNRARKALRLVIDEERQYHGS